MQNLVSIQYTDEEIAQMDAALNSLGALFSRMVTLQADERRELTKLGPKSQAFCDQALAVLLANPQIVPPSLNLAEAQVDKRTLDQLRPHAPRRWRVKRCASSAGLFHAESLSVQLFA